MNELDALKTIDEAFASLDIGAQGRTLAWLKAKYMMETSGKSDAALHPTPDNAPTSRLSMTPKALATALLVKSGPDLVQAAAVYLATVEGRETFGRHALLETMKLATGYFKPTYRKNLTGSLDSLSRSGVLIEVAPDTFAFKAGALAPLADKLKGGR